MARSHTGVALDGPGDKIATDEVDDGGIIRARQIIRTAGTTAAAIQEVTNAAPAASDYGAVVRNIPVGVLFNMHHDALVPVYATLTDTWFAKVGGASGTVVGTLTITYTAADKLVIASVVRT